MGVTIRDPCEIDNGGCQKMCIVVRQLLNYNTASRCACPSGEQLNSDGKTCRGRILTKVLKNEQNSGSDNFILYSSNKMIRGINPAASSLPDAVLPTTPPNQRFVLLHFGIILE